MLGWRQCFAHGEAVINRGFFQGKLCDTDFLEFAVDRGTIWFVGGKKIVQIHPLDFQIGSVPNFCLPEVRFLLADLRCLVGRDAELLTNVRVLQ